MSETYSNYPFVSYDGPDNNNVRAEISVLTGFGNVQEIIESDKGNSMNVIFKVGNTKYKISGWVPVDDPVAAVVKEAEEGGEPIHFRIEQRRKGNIDRTIPISELKKDAETARETTFKSLTAVRKDDADWVISPKAKTNMLEDVTGDSRSANDFSIEELRAMNEKNAPVKKTNNHSFESSPYIGVNPDGSINPGSVAVSVPINIYNFVNRYVEEKGYQVSEMEKIHAVEKLLTLCNKAQIAIYDKKIEKPDLNAGSHTRARALVFECVERIMPLPEEAFTDEEVFRDWLNNAFKKIVNMWNWSINVVKKLM